MHVAFFEHVEQTDLDALGQVGQLIDRENAAIGARHQPVMQHQFVGQITALCNPDRINLADEIGDRRVGRRQLLAVAVAAVHPSDRGAIALGDNQLTRVAGDRSERIVVDL